MAKRGEIYRDSQYTYPAGNTEDKFLIVLNKTHLPTQAIIAAPCTTNKAGRNYNPGCNRKVPLFYILPSKEDFFEHETVVQLAVIGDIDEKIFRTKLSKKIIQYHASLSNATISRLSKCLDEIRDDVPEDFHIFLF